MQWPQSWEQDQQLTPAYGSQIPSPKNHGPASQGPQSTRQVVQLSPLLSDDLQSLAVNVTEPGKLADFIASSLSTIGTTQVKQEVLDTLDVRQRLDTLNRVLIKELMRKVYIIPEETPNAFATGRNPEHGVVAVTHGIMRIPNRDEPAGVLAHELAHIKHRDILTGTIVATVAGAISMLARMAMFFGGGRHDDDEGAGNPAAAIIMMIVAPIAAMLVQMAISRTREYDADAGGVGISGNPYGLANALLKLEQGTQAIPMDANPATAHMFIVNPLSARGLMTLFSTHPILWLNITIKKLLFSINFICE